MKISSKISSKMVVAWHRRGWRIALPGESAYAYPRVPNGCLEFTRLADGVLAYRLFRATEQAIATARALVLK